MAASEAAGEAGGHLLARRLDGGQSAALLCAAPRAGTLRPRPTRLPGCATVSLPLLAYIGRSLSGMPCASVCYPSIGSMTYSAAAKSQTVQCMRELADGCMGRLYHCLSECKIATGWKHSSVLLTGASTLQATEDWAQSVIAAVRAPPAAHEAGGH